MKYRLVASVGAESTGSRGGTGGKGGGGSTVQITHQQGFEDHILTVLGGKASCRRKFVIHVHLVDGEENVVMNMNEELSVVATVAYAHDRSPIVQDDNLFLAEPPLLTTFNGVEYPSHDRPTRLVAGKASFKLAISLLSSKYDNRLFCICFTPFFTSPGTNSAAVPALHLCDPCFSKPIRSISRKRSNTAVPPAGHHQQQQQSHIHSHATPTQSHSHSHTHSVAHSHSINMPHSHSHTMQNMMATTNMSHAHSYYPQPHQHQNHHHQHHQQQQHHQQHQQQQQQQQQQQLMQRPLSGAKEENPSSASVASFDYATSMDLSEASIQQHSYMYHDQHQHQNQHHHHHQQQQQQQHHQQHQQQQQHHQQHQQQQQQQQSQQQFQQQHHQHQNQHQQQHMMHTHQNHPVVETIDETGEPLFNVEQIVGSAAFVGGGIPEAEPMMGCKIDQAMPMQTTRFSPDPLASRSESTSPISGILTSTDGSLQEDADVFSQSSARAGADRPISAPQTGDQVSSSFLPFQASSRVDSNACNPKSLNVKPPTTLETTMSTCKSSSKTVDVAVLQRFFSEATSTNTSTTYPVPALSPESNIEDEEQSLLSLEIALQEAIRELEKKKEELRNKRRRLDEDSYDLHNNINMYPSSNWGVGVEGLSTSFNY